MKAGKEDLANILAKSDLPVPVRRQDGKMFQDGAPPGYASAGFAPDYVEGVKYSSSSYVDEKRIEIVPEKDEEELEVLVEERQSVEDIAAAHGQDPCPHGQDPCPLRPSHMLSPVPHELLDDSIPFTPVPRIPVCMRVSPVSLPASVSLSLSLSLAPPLPPSLSACLPSVCLSAIVSALLTGGGSHQPQGHISPAKEMEKKKEDSPLAVGPPKPVDICVKLGLDFSAAGAAGSARRNTFTRFPFVCSVLLLSLCLSLSLSLCFCLSVSFSLCLSLSLSVCLCFSLSLSLEL